jgi:hypothetical protein
LQNREYILNAFLHSGAKNVAFGKFSKGKENVFSRAYFHFKTMEAVIAFHRGFDEHVFTDSRGRKKYRSIAFNLY